MLLYPSQLKVRILICGIVFALVLTAMLSAAPPVLAGTVAVFVFNLLFIITGIVRIGRQETVQSQGRHGEAPYMAPWIYAL